MKPWFSFASEIILPLSRIRDYDLLLFFQLILLICIIFQNACCIYHLQSISLAYGTPPNATLYDTRQLLMSKSYDH